jgi:hypothetical protein
MPAAAAYHRGQPCFQTPTSAPLWPSACAPPRPPARRCACAAAAARTFTARPSAGDILDIRPHSGITSYEPSELVVTARAGTPLAELEALLAAQGQCLPFEPPHFGGAQAKATVGGMVASGLSGPARASVGAVRDYMLGVVLLNGKGERLVFGGQVMKNVAGYDVSRLMAGSLGTLGVLLEVSLKVLPMAPMEATLVFDMDEAAALQQLNRWGAMPLPVNASCWRGGRLWVRLRGAKAAVAAAQKSMGGEVLDSDAARHWTALREQAQPFFALQGDESLWRLSVPDTAPPLQAGRDVGGMGRRTALAQAARQRRGAGAPGGGPGQWPRHPVPLGRQIRAGVLRAQTAAGPHHTASLKNNSTRRVS